MKTFLLRNIKDGLYIEIKKQAEFNSESINKFVLSVLEGELGFKKQIKKKKRFTDLDGLAGKWNEKEYHLVTQKLKDQRIIDKELWK
jgi:chemotaxis methyl-accepting protein methylase